MLVIQFSQTNWGLLFVVSWAHQKTYYNSSSRLYGCYEMCVSKFQIKRLCKEKSTLNNNKIHWWIMKYNNRNVRFSEMISRVSVTLIIFFFTILISITIIQSYKPSQCQMNAIVYHKYDTHSWSYIYIHDTSKIYISASCDDKIYEFLYYMCGVGVRIYLFIFIFISWMWSFMYVHIYDIKKSI